MALNSVRPACCSNQHLGWAGIFSGLFQHLLGSGNNHREDAAEPGRADGRLSLRLEADAGGLEKELAGLMDGDLAAGKVRPARSPGRGDLCQELSQAPELAGTSPPYCTDGKTETQRENTMTKIVSLYSGLLLDFILGPPCLPEKGGCGEGF